MGTTGLIFAAIAIAWLVYLVPHFARHRGDEGVEEADPANRFSESVRVVKHGTAPLLDQDLEEIGSFEVSTPMTRQAAVDDLRRLERLAAKRRRRVLIALLLVLTAVLGAYAAKLLLWWVPIIPAGLLLVFAVVCRVSVRRMRRSLDSRYAVITRGSDEATVLLSRRDVATVEPASRHGRAAGAGRAVRPGTLWDPVPITMPTYVSKPLAPRTVRTIDLSGPEVTSSGRNQLPVTADAPSAHAPAPPPPPGRQDPWGEQGDERQQAATA